MNNNYENKAFRKQFLNKSKVNYWNESMTKSVTIIFSKCNFIKDTNATNFSFLFCHIFLVLNWFSLFGDFFASNFSNSSRSIVFSPSGSWIWASPRSAFTFSSEWVCCLRLCVLTWWSFSNSSSLIVHWCLLLMRCTQLFANSIFPGGSLSMNNFACQRLIIIGIKNGIF